MKLDIDGNIIDTDTMIGIADDIDGAFLVTPNGGKVELDVPFERISGSIFDPRKLFHNSGIWNPQMIKAIVWDAKAGQWMVHTVNADMQYAVTPREPRN